MHGGRGPAQASRDRRRQPHRRRATTARVHQVPVVGRRESRVRRAWSSSHHRRRIYTARTYCNQFTRRIVANIITRVMFTNIYAYYGLKWGGWWRWAVVSPDGVAPSRWSVCLPLLIFPSAIKSRSSLLAPAHPGGPGERAARRLWWLW